MILNTVKSERGECSLEHLRQSTDEEIKTELERFKGVGKKTIACVLMFCLDRSAPPCPIQVAITCNCYHLLHVPLFIYIIIYSCIYMYCYIYYYHSCIYDMFCLVRHEFPVDTHVWRITKALGWVPAKATRDEAYAHLNARIPDPLK